MKISQCMTRDVRLASPDMSLQDAARLMGECDAGVLPVGENDRLVGIVTDRDLVIRGLADGLGPNATVRQAMSAEVRWCYEDDDIESALECMSDEQIRRMPVLSREKRLVGIVSIGDLAVAARAKDAGEALGAISRPGGPHSQTLH